MAALNVTRLKLEYIKKKRETKHLACGIKTSSKQPKSPQNTTIQGRQQQSYDMDVVLHTYQRGRSFESFIMTY
jgi:hypothetical protein